MTESYLFPPEPVFSLSVKGETARYPVRRIFCVGRNYAKHAAELGNEVDREAPFYFTKSPAHAVESGANVPFAQGTEDYHHEMEFAVALGEGAEVLGYFSALDMTRRDRQNDAKAKKRPWDWAKDVEDSAVLGAITPAATFGEVTDQRIWLKVNGEIRQDATLTELIHDIPAILKHLSGYYHLGAGDVILTGTPAGVGAVQPGDTLEGSIDGLDPVVLHLQST